MASDATPEQAEQTAEANTVGLKRTQDQVIVRLPTLNRLLRAVLPPEAVGHLYAAQREQLLAMRAVIDAAVERLDRAQRGEQAQRERRRTDIAVE
jgi:hypothetical protein